MKRLLKQLQHCPPETIVKKVFYIQAIVQSIFGNLRKQYLKLAQRLYQDKVTESRNALAEECNKRFSTAHETAKELAEHAVESMGRKGKKRQ